ncbi:MAG: hypothetical protein D6813_11355, partial [Calditrichaeota bacterium]
GYIWIGTQDGLNRYDGYSFVRYTHDPFDDNSLPDKAIEALYVDKKGTLWISTFGGVCRLDNHEAGYGKITRYNLKHIGVFHEDKNGILWLAGEGGLIKYDKAEDEMIRYPYISQIKFNYDELYILAIIEDNSGNLYVATNIDGVSKVQQENDSTIRFVHYLNAGSDSNDPWQRGPSAIQYIYSDAFNVLWLGSNGRGLFQLEGWMTGTPQFHQYKKEPLNPKSLGHNRIRAVYTDNNGTVWIGTDGAGLDRFDRVKNEFQHYRNDPADPHSLSQNQVWAIFQDRSGIIWVGTNGGGVCKFDPNEIKFHLYHPEKAAPNSRSNTAVWSFYESANQDIWVGTSNGLFRLQQDQQRNTTFEHFDIRDRDSKDKKSLQIRAIYEDASHVLWLGTLGSGLAKFNPKNRELQFFKSGPHNSHRWINNYIYAILEARPNELWIATNGGGLNRFDIDKNIFTHVSLLQGNHEPRNMWIVSLHNDPQGYLWIGTWENGLIKYDERAGTVKYYQHDPNDANSLTNNTIFAIHEDKNGILWIGTYGGGLNRFDPETEKFKAYTERDGLPNNVIYGILEDSDGNLWLSSNHGLSRFDPQTETFLNYDLADGLQSNEFNLGAYYKTHSGEMFFGGNKGFNSFYPAEVVNPYPPAIVFTAFKKFGKKVNLGRPLASTGKIKLSYRDDLFGFEFVALHYKNPAKNQYAYMLERFDQDWIYLGHHHEVSFTNLDPGKYTFKVKAANSDGVWNEQAASIALMIKPPFWQQMWFFVLAGAMVLIAAYSFYKVRVRRVVAIERAKAAAREAAQRTMLEDFHDDLGQRISKISMLGKALKMEATELPTTMMERLNRIIGHADRVIDDMRIFMREHDPEQSTLYHLAEHLKDVSDDLFDDTDIAFQLSGLTEAMEQIKLPVLWQQQLMRIFQEAMTNVLKHAEGCKHVFLHIMLADKQLQMILKNDGRGFNIDAIKQGFGLKNMLKRAEKLNGKLEINSNIDRGTEVHFTGKLP